MMTPYEDLRRFWQAILILLVLLAISLISLECQEKSPWDKESYLLNAMFQKVSDGIVYCYSGNSKTTGFFVSKDGWIITAAHKVDRDFPQTNKIFIKFKRTGKEEIYEAVKIATPAKGWDLLLLKIDYKPKFYFKQFKNPYLFEENWVFGFRGSADLVPSSPGYASFDAVNPKLLYTTARIYYGNSGSPVINRYGEVLGIAVQGVPGVWDGLFIPSSIIKEYIEATLKEEKGEEK